MKPGTGPLQEPSLHVILLAAVLALMFLPSRSTSQWRFWRSTHIHGIKCHACRVAGSQKERLARDSALIRAGFIEAPEADD